MQSVRSTRTLIRKTCRLARECSSSPAARRWLLRPHGPREAVRCAVIVAPACGRPSDRFTALTGPRPRRVRRCTAPVATHCRIRECVRSPRSRRGRDPQGAEEALRQDDRATRRPGAHGVETCDREEAPGRVRHRAANPTLGALDRRTGGPQVRWALIAPAAPTRGSVERNGAILGNSRRVAYRPGSRVVISRSIHPWPSGLPHPQVEARDEPS